MGIKKLFSEQDKKNISEAIRQIELSTSGELVPVVSNKSNNYYFQRLIFSVFFSYFIAEALLFIPYFFVKLEFILLIHLAIFLILFSITSLDFVTRRIVTKKQKYKAVKKQALAAFYSNELYETSDRTGILIYISLLEKQVVVLGDKGINSKLHESSWEDVVKIIISGIKSKSIANGLIEGIKACTELLKTHFPIKANDVNEIKNELIIKEFKG